MLLILNKNINKHGIVGDKFLPRFFIKNSFDKAQIDLGGFLSKHQFYFSLPRRFFPTLSTFFFIFLPSKIN